VAELLRGLAGREPIETHISAVFVGADTVWKLRKAVRLPFLDFTPLVERERTARRELELNAPHAPGMYRDVVAVTRGAGGLALGGEGEAVDWVLRMAPVPPGDFLDRMAAEGRLDGPLLDDVADAVAAMHARLPAAARDQVAGFAWLADGNRESALTAGLPAGEVAAWYGEVSAALAARAEWLRGRERDGFVRRIHGDLHLGNLCLWQGAPVPFDALEFDERLATFDVGYDLAFLLMDLDVRAGRAAANRVMNRCLARSGDVDLLAGLAPFLSLRAMVRAHVEARSGHPAVALSYLARARDYLRPAAPMVVAIGGLPGSGKSTVARALAPGLGAAPGAVILRSDEIRKRLRGVAPETRLPPEAYAPDVSAAVFAELARLAGVAAGAGHAVIADATFMDPAHRAALEAVARGVPFHGFWLAADLAELEARIAGRRGDASDADVAVLRRAAAADPGPRAWTEISAGAADRPAEAVRLIIGIGAPH
jgi:aminoglycoside phosphotransferase family enzyme/predicted kinase